MRNATGMLPRAGGRSGLSSAPAAAAAVPGTAAPLAARTLSASPLSATSGTAVVTPSAVFCNSSRLFIVRPSCLPCRPWRGSCALQRAGRNDN